MPKGGNNRWYVAAFICVILLAAALRLYKLDLKPLHHDEGVHIISFLFPLLRGEAVAFYAEHHGLLVHYIGALSVKLLGFSTFSIRLPFALFGILTVAILFFFQDHLGKKGALCAAALIAVSPNLVYYSRTYSLWAVQSFMLLLTLLIILKLLKTHRPLYLYLLAICVGLLLNLVMEVFIILMIIAIGFFYLRHLFGASNVPSPHPKSQTKQLRPLHYALAIILALFVFSLLHTCFFQRLSNLTDLGGFFSYVQSKAINTGHNKPTTYYVATQLLPFELGAVLLAAYAMLRNKKPMLLQFIIFWALCNMTIYSLISYKTNWTFTVVILPLLLAAGYAAEVLPRRDSAFRIGSVIMVLCICLNLFFAIQQNFLVYDDYASNKLGYVETSTQIFKTLSKIDTYAAKHPNPKILITAKSYSPLPAYLWNYSVSYLQDLSTLNLEDFPQYDIFIADISQSPDMYPSFKRYTYELRENLNIRIYLRNASEQ